jgi:ABC-type bacteriocin/lantibiotic exporter with double-glycine peptidase domain
MQVYDRVIPAQSYPTLYVSTGVLVAVLFGFLLREARTHNGSARQTRRYAHFRSRV